MLNLLLVDDHFIIRSGLRLLISNFLPFCGIEEVQDGDSAFEKIKRENFDLVILDANMPGTDSFSLVRNILAFKPDTKILMFTMGEETTYAKRYLELGVRGYLQKSEANAEIQKAITTVLDNKTYISPRLNQLLIEDLYRGESPNPFTSLSTREFEIFQHLAVGKSVSEISKKLELSPSTVGTYKARVFQKLNCSNVVDLNALAKIYNVTGS